MTLEVWVGAVAAILLAGVVVYDLTQRQHAILRTFPLVGHNEERPFSRDQRRWIYASAKRENNYFGSRAHHRRSARVA